MEHLASVLGLRVRPELPGLDRLVCESHLVRFGLTGPPSTGCPDRWVSGFALQFMSIDLRTAVRVGC